MTGQQETNNSFVKKMLSSFFHMKVAVKFVCFNHFFLVAFQQEIEKRQLEIGITLKVSQHFP
jgi:hypothetical protein